LIASWLTKHGLFTSDRLQAELDVNAEPGNEKKRKILRVEILAWSAIFLVNAQTSLNIILTITSVFNIIFN
jgi:hypothetical protein